MNQEFQTTKPNSFRHTLDMLSFILHHPNKSSKIYYGLSCFGIYYHLFLQ